MSSRYKAYPEYKDSGVDWLGGLPLTWKATALKRLCKLRTGLTPSTANQSYYSDEKTEYPWFRPEDLIDGLGETTASKYLSLSGWSVMRPVPANSVLICCIGTIGKAGFSKVVATTNQQITAASFEQEARYYFYAILSASEVLDEVATGNVLKILNSERLGSLYFPIPPLPEQKQIARFLDYETGKIDLLIEKQQALIALLKEKRQAVISHAVTKGLNPHARMKDSGVEWLGEVPEGWAVAKLSYRYEVLLGKMLDDKKITGNYLGAYLRNTDVQWDEINDQDLPSMDFRPDEQSRFSVKKGDLLVCEGGEIGRCAIWEKDEPCYYQKALHRLRPLKIQTDSTRYMFYLLYNAVHEERFISGAGKSTIAHLPAETFKQYRFAFPPKDEQEEIFSYLDTMNDKFNATESSALKGIDLLQERRTALISAAVTGKIDVRDWELEAQSV